MQTIKENYSGFRELTADEICHVSGGEDNPVCTIDNDGNAVCECPSGASPTITIRDGTVTIRCPEVI